MALQVEATYENGALKLDRPLPLKEHERIVVTIQPKASRVDETAGLIGWKGTAEAYEHLTRDEENSGWGDE